MFVAIRKGHADTASFLLRCGASLGARNKRRQSPYSICSPEVLQVLASRVEDWKEQPHASGKRKRDECRAEGPETLKAWSCKRAKCHEEEPVVMQKDHETVTENDTHFVTNLHAACLGKVRQLEKSLIVDQANLFQNELWCQACRVKDYCDALGAFADDRIAVKVMKQIVTSTMNTRSIVLVAVDKATGHVVGYCHADTKKNDLLIAHLKVQFEHQGCGVGRLLVDATEAKAFQRGWEFDTASLFVLRENSVAVRRFTTMDFEIESETLDSLVCPLSRCYRMVRTVQKLRDASRQHIQQTTRTNGEKRDVETPINSVVG